MWKNVRFKKGVISLLLIIGLVLTNMSPIGAWAEDAVVALLEQNSGSTEAVSNAAVVVAANARAAKDVEPIVRKTLTKTLLQHGKLVAGNTIDLKAPVKVRLGFNVPVAGDFKNSLNTTDPNNYIISGDWANIVVDKSLKLSNSHSMTALEIFDKVKPTPNKIGEATFSNSPDGVVMKFDFKGDANNNIYNGERNTVTVEVDADFEIDETNANTLPNGDKTIDILGKKYTIEKEKPSNSVSVKKTGEVNFTDDGTGYYGKDSQGKNRDIYPNEADNMSITWTVEVTRAGNSLEGYRFRDRIADVGKYQKETLKVDGFRVDDSAYNDTTGEISYTFPTGTGIKAIITFNTRLTFEEFKKGTSKTNTAVVDDEKGNFAGKDSCTVTWNPDWGSKTAEIHKDSNNKEFQYRKGADGNYYIDWQIEFNNDKRNLKNVRVIDKLKKDRLEEFEQEFVSAKLEKKVGGTWTFDRNILYPTKQELYNGYNELVYEIGDISYPVRLTIESRIKDSSSMVGRRSFENYAVVLWGSDWKADFSHEITVGDDDALITKRTDTDRGAATFDQVWDITVKKNNLLDENNTAVYDAFIFKPDISLLWNIKQNNTALMLKDDSDNEVNLPSTIKLNSVITKHYRFNKFLGEFKAISPTTLTHKVYKIHVKNTGEYIGDLVEVRGFKKDQDNNFSLKSRITTPELIMKPNESSYNIAYLTHNNKIIDNARYWAKFKGRMIQKQALTADTAKKITGGNYTPDVVNENVYDENVPEANLHPETAAKALDNKLTAYNRDDSSIIYRISVNAAGIHDISQYIGDAKIYDGLPNGWEFVPIQGNKMYLMYEGESYAKVYSEEATVKATTGPIATPAGFTASINGRDAKFKFEKLDKPYVILLRAQLKNLDAYAGKEGVIPNTAELTIDKYTAKSTQNVIFSEKALNKSYDAGNIKNGNMTWTIDYRPYNFRTDKDPYMEDNLSKGIEIRRNTDKTLSFNNDNYQMLEGHFVNDVFVQDRKLSVTELQPLLSYNETNRILTIKILNKHKAYRFIYVTDIAGKGVGETVDNLVLLKEGDKRTHIESPKNYVIERAYGGGTSKGFVNFTINKIDEDGGAPLAGAKFELTYPSNKKDILETASDGAVKTGKLTYGLYTLKEIKAPAGYQRDNTVYTVKVNELTTGFEIVIENNTNPLVSVQDDVITVKNKKKVITEADIELVKADIIDAPGFILSHSLTDIKHPLAKAKFSLRHKTNNAISYSAITGSNGKLTFEGVKQGTYLLKEEEAPKGYASLMTKEYEVIVTPNAVAGQKVQVNSGNPDPVKQTGDTIVVFNRKYNEIKLVKADLADKAATTLSAISKRLDGAEFTLSGTLSGGRKVSFTQTTTKGGILTFSSLEDGTYKLKETKAPEGYVPVLGKEYEITVTRGAVNSEVAIKDADNNQIKLLDDNATIAVFNERVANLTLVKADITDKNAVSIGAIQTRLNGAKFILTRPDTTTAEAITAGTGEFTFKSLKKGTYTLEEMEAPNGYNALMHKYEITVNPGEVPEFVIKDADADKIKLVDGKVVVFNEKREGAFNLKLVKADISDKTATSPGGVKIRLDGAEFKLTHNTDNTVSQSAITTAGGILTFAGLPEGTYTLKEVNAPEGYAPLMDKYEVTITPSALSGKRIAIKDANGNEIKRFGDTIVVFNNKLYNLKLLKADFDSNKAIVTKAGITLGAIKTPLDGAKFRLMMKGDSAVSYSAVTGVSPEAVGSLTFKGLKSGTYVLTEEVAPGGYTAVTGSYEITVTAGAINPSYAIKDAKEGEIRKVDDTVVVFNKKTPTTPGYNPPGPVVPLEPRNPDNPPTPPTPPTPTPNIPTYPSDNPPDPNDPNSPDEFVSVDEDGTPQGRYKKVKKPDGKNEYIEVDEDDTPQGVKKVKNLPKTGGSDSVVYYAGGIMLILLAAGMVVVRRKKHNK